MRNAEVNRHRRRRPTLLDDPDTDLDRLAVAPAGAPPTPEEVVVGEQFDEVVHACYARAKSRQMTGFKIRI